jgi:hypothetical protein
MTIESSPPLSRGTIIEGVYALDLPGTSEVASAMNLGVHLFSCLVHSNARAFLLVTNNPPAGCRPSNRLVLSCKQQIIALSKVCNVNNTNVFEHKIVVFSLVAIAHLQF